MLQFLFNRPRSIADNSVLKEGERCREIKRDGERQRER